MEGTVAARRVVLAMGAEEELAWPAWAEALRKAVRLVTGEVRSAAAAADGSIRLVLEGGAELAADRLLLATGFAAERPGGRWLGDAIETLGLRCAACGFPVVERTLEWHAGSTSPVRWRSWRWAPPPATSSGRG